MLKKAISLILSVSLILTQPVFAQGAAELNIGKYLNQMPAVKTDSFRPARLRYVSYDVASNDFKLLLDQGDAKLSNSLNSLTPKLQDATQELFNYFLIGLSLPNDKFWVNLRPDAPQQIIDPLLEKTDMGKIMLEADLQLKKDTASLTSPQNPEGKEYWDKLYKKAGELFGTENITIPTITRPWIVPGEVIIRESEDSAYIYKANLKVMLEEDYLRRTKDEGRGTIIGYGFNDPRLKELNKYSTELIKELILPRLTQEINTSKKYAQLRQVFFSLILSRWFKDKYKGKPGQYSGLIDSRNLDKLSSKESWNKEYYFNEYKKSFQQGEYNLKEQVSTPTGPVIRSYVSGGADMTGRFIEGGFKSIGTSSPIDWQTASLIGISIVLIAGGVTVFYKFIKKGVMPTADYIRKFKIIEGGINAALGYADKGMLSADDAILLHKRFRNYQDMGVEEVIEIIEGTITLLEQPYPKPRNKINQENRERVITILEESLKAAGSSPLMSDSMERKIKSVVFRVNKSLERYVYVYRKHSLGIIRDFFFPLPINEKKIKNLSGLNTSLREIKEKVMPLWFKAYELWLYGDKFVNKITNADLAKMEASRVEFLAEIDKYMSEIRALEQHSAGDQRGSSSALTQNLPQNTDSPLMPGGIDFTRIHYLARPMGSFQGLDLRLPRLSKSELEGIDIKQELVAIEQMINAKIDVSTDRLKRLLAAMSQKDAFTSQRETQLLPLLLRLCWLKEEKGRDTTPDFRAVLLIADTGLFVEQGNTRYLLN